MHITVSKIHEITALTPKQDSNLISFRSATAYVNEEYATVFFQISKTMSAYIKCREV